MRYFFGICFAMGVLSSAWAAESGVVLKAEALRKEPYTDAGEVAILNAGEKVSILKKNGGWLNVKSAKATGWVRMLSIRKGEARQARNAADNLKSLSTGRAGKGQVVATTGIRGLNEEELKSAKFNAEELGKVESYQVSRTEALGFAKQGKLKTVSMDYLPVQE